eukprot:COSAG04_NODE_2711_length_3697_cov_5.529739_2_plen_56_part_00
MSGDAGAPLAGQEEVEMEGSINVKLNAGDAVRTTAATTTAAAATAANAASAAAAL